jgi:hypothetical protein
VITQEILADKILQYLNNQITLTELVSWAEDAILTFTESDQRPPHADVIWDILLYMGVADSADFPLTWEIIRDWLECLGHPVQTVIA